MNTKGISAVVTMMIMVLLVVVAGGIVWVMVNKTIEGKLDAASSCNNLIGKIEFNSLYTCYDPVNDEVQFSINIKDVEVNEIYVSVADEDSSEVFVITSTSQVVSGLESFGGSSSVKIPSRNSGDTYIANGFASEPTRIEVAPRINGNLCGISDSISNIGTC